MQDLAISGTSDFTEIFPERMPLEPIIIVLEDGIMRGPNSHLALSTQISLGDPGRCGFGIFEYQL